MSFMSSRLCPKPNIYKSSTEFVAVPWCVFLVDTMTCIYPFFCLAEHVLPALDRDLFADQHLPHEMQGHYDAMLLAIKLYYKLTLIFLGLKFHVGCAIRQIAQHLIWHGDIMYREDSLE